jgi:hypothetical protein
MERRTDRQKERKRHTQSMSLPFFLSILRMSRETYSEYVSSFLSVYPSYVSSFLSVYLKDRQKERKRHTLMESESDCRERVRDKRERQVDFVDNNKRRGI